MNAEREIQAMIERLAGSWNGGDWQGFSQLFAEDADYVTAAAVLLAGRDRIRDDLSNRAGLSAAHGEVALVSESVKMLRPDVAVALCSWQMRLANDSGTRAGLLTLVMLRGVEGWRIVALHNAEQRD